MGYRCLVEGKRIAKRLVKIMDLRGHWSRENYPEMHEGWVKRTLQMFRKTKVPCSCFMCKCEKKLKLPTRQEIRAMEREKEQLAEINIK